MNIITISREFGSGGRELGKRLADAMNYDYYDREIIGVIADNQGLNENYIETTLENHGWQTVPLSFRCSFAGASMLQVAQTKLLLEQKKVIEKIADAGKDCIIVGRNADVILADHNPFSIFVCADMPSRLRRCKDRAPAGENLSEKELVRNIRRIDKGRAATREILTESEWGQCRSYNITVNTTDWEIKELVPAIEQFAFCRFRRTL